MAASWRVRVMSSGSSAIGTSGTGGRYKARSARRGPGPRGYGRAFPYTSLSAPAEQIAESRSVTAARRTPSSAPPTKARLASRSRAPLGPGRRPARAEWRGPTTPHGHHRAGFLGRTRAGAVWTGRGGRHRRCGERHRQRPRSEQAERSRPLGGSSFGNELQHGHDLHRYCRPVELHDSVFVRLQVDWEADELSIDLRVAESEVAIHASGLRKLSVVWAFPGKTSRPIDRVDLGHEKLNIEMQGGGHVRVEAAKIEMP